jgi:polyisoprenoid-binding protein YceI
MTKSATISFHSHTFLEDVDAVNNQVLAVIDLNKKNMAFSSIMKNYVFRKKLMQEHFNENYIESDKFPKSTFSGTYSENVPADKDGTYPVTVKGKIFLHGVSKDVSVPATLTIKGATITGSATFKLNPADFDISIPFIVRDKIEKENTVRVNAEWTKKY